MIELSEGQLRALRGLAMFMLEEYQYMISEDMTLPHISHLADPFLMLLDIRVEDYQVAYMVLQSEMNFLANDCQEQQQN